MCDCIYITPDKDYIYFYYVLLCKTQMWGWFIFKYLGVHLNTPLDLRNNLRIMKKVH